MAYLLAFHQVEVLDGAGARGVTGHFPHLRFVSLLPPADTAEAAQRLPEHVRGRVNFEPTPELLDSGRIKAILTTDRRATAAAFPALDPADIVTWDDVPAAYERWLRSDHLPANAVRSTYTPEGLLPVDWTYPKTRIELIGSCAAEFMQQVVGEVGRQLDADIECSVTVQNHPTGAAPATGEPPTVRLVVPPLRYMHPATLDDFVAHPDHERLFAETREHMVRYLESVAAADTTVPLFVLGFIEPHQNPAGSFFHARELSNFKYFVRCLNDAIVEWCEGRPGVHFVDGDAAAAAIGKIHVDEGPLAFFAHRAPIDPYDDWIDQSFPTPAPGVRESYASRAGEFYAAVIREVVHRQVILSGAARVKAVIVDLDNTLWRGLASDGTVGSWNGRPQGIVEALKILKRRGVFLAIASKNDESYIREHWDAILHQWSDVPLGDKLSLDDFDAVRINFRPKSANIAEMLAELNVHPESAVFVDDNPLEREEVQSVFPQIRVLGAEINYVRRELLHSPFTQFDVRTREDAVRSATARKQAALKEHLSAGTAADFLQALQLVCQVDEVTDPASAAGQRALQLINKTNQWNVNGARISAADFEAALEGGHRLFVAEVRDAGNAYGIVGVALVEPAASLITHLVVSCRVIGMGIDDAFIHDLSLRFGPLELAYADSGRNRGVAAFFERHTGTVPAADGNVAVGAIEAPAHVRIEGAASVADEAAAWIADADAPVA
jgi:FkbH-like protein